MVLRPLFLGTLLMVAGSAYAAEKTGRYRVTVDSKTYKSATHEFLD